jgi:excinuclease UvrABC nuclease subunit
MTTIVLGQINSLEMHTFRLLLGPGVYTLWCKDEALYVGSAKNLMHRISHPRHEQLRRALKEATRIEFDYHAHEQHARDFEARKIVELQPKYNRIGKLDSTHRLDPEWPSP